MMSNFADPPFQGLPLYEYISKIYCVRNMTFKSKGKLQVHPNTGHEDPEGK